MNKTIEDPKPVHRRHISYVYPQCYWSLEEQPAPVAEPHKQQEPVCDKDPLGCWSIRCQLGKMCKNTPPASKPWVHATTWRGLTPAEAGALWKVGMTPHEFSCAIEAKLKEKNGF